MRRTARVFLLLALASATLPAEEPESLTVYLSREEALARVFPEADRVLSHAVHLDETEWKTAQKHYGRPLRRPWIVYAGYLEEKLLGYAVITSELGKFDLFDFIVGVDPGGKVTRVAVMVYRESRGGEIAHRRFLSQLEGKTLKDPLRLNRDLKNIVGATMSVRSIAAGVRKVLAVIEATYRRGTRRPDDETDAPPPEPPEKDDAGEEEPGGEDQGRMHRQARYVMGTLLEVQAVGLPREEAMAAMDAAFEEVERLDRMLSTYRPESPVSRLTGPAPGEPIEVPPELARLLERCREFSSRCGGGFDVTVGPWVDLWRSAAERGVLPTTEERAATAALVGWEALQVEGDRVRWTRPGMSVDLGGVGKGYALDRAVDVLRSCGVAAALLNFGGQIAAYGLPSGKAGWEVIVPGPGGGDPTTEILCDGSIAASGSAERRFRIGEEELSHLIDPRTGEPIPLGRTAVVRARTAEEADRLATAAVVLGVTEGTDLMLASPGVRGRVWEVDGARRGPRREP